MLGSCERRLETAQEPVPVRYSQPERNSAIGDGKKVIWADAAYYVPDNRTNYADHTPTPPFRHRQPFNFRSEDQWEDYVRNRDQPSGLYCPSVADRMLRDSDLHLNAYHQAWDHHAPPGFWPYRTDPQWKYCAWRPKHPPQRPPHGKGHAPYLGYYHEKFHKDIIPQHQDEYGHYAMGPLEEMPPNMRGKWEGYYDKVFENERNRRHWENPTTSRLCSNLPLYAYTYNSRWGFHQP